MIDNAIRDLDYHAEMLSLLKLPPQQDRDAVMILHLGGVFGDKEATLQRFRDNYAKLSADVKKRLVLENDDVSWSVHDLLPVCEELNIPMVLDFHHHNIIFDSDKIREGTKDIIELFPRIIQTWRRKNITPKMHYSEPTPAAITGRQRRKHSPRVATLPPCPPDTDLMIEAKDKEQAVFELMRTFKLPGYDTFNDLTPHVRRDDNKILKTPKKKSKKGEEAEEEIKIIPDDEVGMGGPDRRVYWPPGMEEWLRPVKRVVKKKDAGPKAPTPKKAKAPPQEEEATVAEADEAAPIVAKKAKSKGATTKPNKPSEKQTPKRKRAPAKDETTDSSDAAEESKPVPPRKAAKRNSRGKQVNYAEDDE